MTTGDNFTNILLVAFAPRFPYDVKLEIQAIGTKSHKEHFPKKKLLIKCS